MTGQPSGWGQILFKGGRPPCSSPTGTGAEERLSASISYFHKTFTYSLQRH